MLNFIMLSYIAPHSLTAIWFTQIKRIGEFFVGTIRDLSPEAYIHGPFSRLRVDFFCLLHMYSDNGISYHQDPENRDDFVFFF